MTRADARMATIACRRAVAVLDRPRRPHGRFAGDLPECLGCDRQDASRTARPSHGGSWRLTTPRSAVMWIEVHWTVAKRQDLC
jgi:hypothetical protein